VRQAAGPQQRGLSGFSEPLRAPPVGRHCLFVAPPTHSVAAARQAPANAIVESV
jgi:hypothetical protein